MPHEKLCARVLELEAENRDRRSWVWADLGYSMMAHALEPLANSQPGALCAGRRVAGGDGGGLCHRGLAL